MVSCTCSYILHHHFLHSFWRTCRYYIVIPVLFVRLHHYCHVLAFKFFIIILSTPSGTPADTFLLIIIVSFVHYYCHGGWNAVCTFHHVHSYKRNFLGCQLYWYILHWYTHVSNCSRYTIHLGHLLVGAVPNTLHTKRHNRAYSSLNCMNMWHQTFYACAVDAYCHISPSPCS